MQKKSSIIYGNNMVRSSLKLGSVRRLFVAKGYTNKTILDEVNKSGVEVIFIDHRELDKMTNGAIHQGIVAEIKPLETVSLEEILAEGKKIANPILVMLDELSDPHNLGAILRSGDAFNIQGIIYKNRGEVSLNETVAKVSTGAVNYVKCCAVTNLSQTIATLKKEGYWIIGLDGLAKTDLKSIPANAPLCVVVGSEGNGISRLVRENCDLLVKIPMLGHVSCLNASVACSIALYQIRNR